MAEDRFLDTEGLRHLWEKIKDFFQSHQPTIPEYTIERLATAETGYSSSYILKKDNVQVGATINIPLDMVVSNGEVKTVTTADVPYQGAKVGDKYIDLTIANASSNHIYIPVKDLVDVYLAGNGIQISNNNYISVKINQNQANGLAVGGDGVMLAPVTPSVSGVGGTNGAMTATDKEKLDKLRLNSTEVILNGRSGSSGIQPWSLCAFAFDTSRFSAAIMYMTSFTATAGQGGGAAITGYAFPIGCKIYYHPDTTLFTASTDFTSKKFYSSYDDVDGRYSSNTGVSLSLSSSTSSSVYLRVDVDEEASYWRPYHKDGESYENICTPDGFIANNYYIYLGKTVGSTGYKFQLEDNNPLYYYDGDVLLSWAVYYSRASLLTKADKVSNATSGNFAGLDSNGNLTDSGYKPSDFVPNRVLLYFNDISQIGQNESFSYSLAVGSQLPAGTYKVTVMRHIWSDGSSLGSDNVVNATVYFKKYNSNTKTYIVGGTYVLRVVTSPNNSLDRMCSTVVYLTGFLSLNAATVANDNVCVVFEGSQYLTMGGEQPLSGSNIEAAPDVDFILFERII